ncbi:MAG TPA: COX15/CtaA family protein [Solirubrobacteraceae bacterium]|jgi:cytochrome c oxidase assembly protein subunit 15|nr:COX15/CtaA family protein [Solirubrobacteraceae bacterium]
MARRLSSLRERRLTPSQYVRVADLGVGAFVLIVMTGAAVRLSGSGLGCPNWPRCFGRVYPPVQSHALVEFSNRMVTVPVCIIAFAAYLLAFRREPYRRDLVWLSSLLPLGVLAQAVLGGLTVRGALDYGWVMGHFGLSMLCIVAAAALAWRARREPGARPATEDRQLVWLVRGVCGLGALTLFAGTAATAAGPHAGGSPGQRINRLDFDGRATMDFVIHRHAEIGFAFGVAALAAYWLAGRRGASPGVRGTLRTLCLLLAAQGAVGMIQYQSHLPSEIVWVHVSLAAVTWLVAVWAAAAVGRVAPARVPEERPAELARVPA